MSKPLPTLRDLLREMIVLVEAIGITLLKLFLGEVLEEAATGLVETTAKGGIITKDRTTTGTEITSEISHSLPSRFSIMESISLQVKIDLMI